MKDDEAASDTLRRTISLRTADHARLEMIQEHIEAVSASEAIRWALRVAAERIETDRRKAEARKR